MAELVKPRSRRKSKPPKPTPSRSPLARVDQASFTDVGEDVLGVVNVPLDGAKIEKWCAEEDESGKADSHTSEYTGNLTRNGAQEAENREPLELVVTKEGSEKYCNLTKNEAEVPQFEGTFNVDNSKTLEMVPTEEEQETCSQACAFISPYTDLVNDLSKCVDEISLPTAPEIVTPPVVASVKTNLQIAVEKPPVEGPFMKDLLDTVNVEDEIIQDFMPFTEKDLEAIYQNEELEASVSFLENFSTKYKPDEDELFTLLTEYGDRRKNDRENEKDLETIRNEFKECEKNLWAVWPDVLISERGKCADGNDVILTHKYQQARFNKTGCLRFQELLAKMKMEVTKEQWPNAIAIKLCGMKVESLLCGIQNSCVAFTECNDLLMSVPADEFSKSCIERLCKAVATLFYFLRKVPAEEDEEFVEKLKKWLSALLGILIRVGSWQDHLFILCHVLCSPPTIASWAASFVQCPPRSPDHSSTLLAVLLRPVARREAFLEDRLESGPWVLVDEDGEDNSDPSVVKENILFRLLTQVPLQELLRHYLLTDRSAMTDLALVKLLAFFSSLVETLLCGLLTYSDEEHRQFGKRLGKLVRDLMELATDELELLVGSELPSPRVQAEYDAFLVRATRALLAAPPVWQFLAAAPFQKVSDSARWRLYLDLVFADGCTVNHEGVAFRLASLADAELYHLLSALCNLALASGRGPKKLVRTVALQMFYVGFVNSMTRDSTYKSTKSLLASMCSEHEYLLSELLEVYNHFMETKELDEEASLVELWQALPVAGWVPSEADFSLLINWLQMPPWSSRCEMARCILRLLDYDVIGRDVQKTIACAVVRSSRNFSGDVKFSQFSWTLLCQLKLHAADCRNGCLTDVSDVSQDAELGLLLSDNVPTAAFFALQTTSVGHFVPVIYNEGFRLVRLLLNDCRYEAAFACIDYMATMFWDCPDSLISCLDFLSLLGDIVVVDESYMKMAKNLIVSDQPGPILRKFAAMLHAHLGRSGVDTLSKAVNLWLLVLTGLPLWQHSTGTIYLLDIVCRRSFNHPGAWLQVLTVLEAALQTAGHGEPRSPLASFLRFGSTPSPPALLPRGCNGSAPWFAFAALSVEFDLVERRTSLWSELLRELWNGRGKKTSIDATLKKVCSSLKLPLRTSSQLIFYRWAAQALEMPESHPLNILVWEKLLSLYMMRVPGLANRGSPGACFFHGVTNAGLLKRLSERLSNLSIAQPSLAATFQTLALWLKEPVVLEANLLVPALPAQYNAPLLAALLSGENHLWYSLLPLGRMREDLAKDALAWESVLGRVRRSLTRSVCRAPDPPDKRILLRLVDFGTPTPLPALSILPGVLPKFSLPGDMHRLLTEHLYPAHYRVRDFITLYKDQVKNINAFEAVILRTAGKIYTSHQSEVTLKERCGGVFDEQSKIRRVCSGPAVLTLKHVNWSHDGKAQHTFDDNLEKLRKALVGGSIGWDVATACLFLEYVADLFVEESYRVELDSAIFAVGLELFSKLLGLWQIAENVCPVIAELLVRSIVKIGKSCIADRPEQSLDLLKTIFEVPNATFLHQLFNPNACSGNEFAEMYRRTLEQSSDTALLARFDVARWLENPRVKSSTRSKLLSVLFSALRNPKFSPKRNPSMHEHLNSHLKLLTLLKFPDHYGEILQELLNSECATSSASWYTFLNALAPSGLSLHPDPDGLSLKNIVDFISHFAAEQTLLPFSLLHNTTSMLGGKWRDLRLREGSLYPRFQPSLEPLLVFSGLISQSLVVRLLADRQGLLSTQVVEIVWPLLEDLFTPWLVPYVLAGNKLQQPFKSEDAHHAEFAASMFTESVRFLVMSLSGAETVMGYVLRFYIKYLCLEHVDGKVLAVMHAALAALPWNAACPNFQDVEAILQVVNLYVPLCHGFLGNVFVSVDWSAVVRRNLASFGSELNARFHVCLLHLLVKFPSEPSLKKNKAVKQLVEVSTGYAWHLVDAGTYESIISWFACSCNPDVVLEDPVSDYHEMDTLVLRLLQVAAGYDANTQYFHPSTPAKRQMFVSATVKCLATAASRRKRHTKAIHKAVAKMLTDIETIVASTVPEPHRVNEATVLLTEVLGLLSESKLAVEVEEGLVLWLSAGRCPLITTALLRCAGTGVDNPVHFGTLIEAGIESHFSDSVGVGWQPLVQALMPYAGGTVPMDQVLISNGCFLTLHALNLHRLRLYPAESRHILTMLLQMLTTVKPNDESEPKLLLLAGLALMLTLHQPDAAATLQILGDNMSVLAADRGGGFLSTIGLKKATAPSIKMKLCCLTAAAGISKILLSQYSHISDDKSLLTLERADSNKQFFPIIPHLLNVRRDLANVKDHAQLLSLLYTTAAQLYNKPYFEF